MNPSREDLVRHYSSLSTERLVELQTTGQLTQLASMLLAEELGRRQVTTDIIRTVQVNIEHQKQTRTQAKHLLRAAIRVFLGILAGFFILGILVAYDADKKSASNNVKPTGPPVALPNTGVLGQWLLVKYGTPQAPLEIVTSDSAYHTYVKIQRADRDFTAFTLFIRSGETVDCQIPAGSYRIKYATGRVWYGEEQLFGNETSYWQAGEKYEFSIEGDRAKGHHIELIYQPNGNLSTRKIPRSSF